LEVNNSLGDVLDAIQWLQEAFRRTIRLQKGLEFQIPIEIELGYDLGHMVTIKCASLNEIGLAAIYNGLVKPVKVPKPTISGQPLQSSQQPANVMCG
jgi:hypothetical protein